jgi:cation diffusion facilitator CzcD-associated flavoprotein CzcO
MHGGTPVLRLTLWQNSKWKWPEIRGLDTYKGHKVHSARWDDSFDFTGKKVAVIGNGSSAIQIVPVLRRGMLYPS